MASRWLRPAGFVIPLTVMAVAWGWAAGAAVAAGNGSPAAPAEKKISALDLAAVAAKLGPSLVRVEYTLRHDKGEEPRAYGLSSPDAGESVQDERPLEVAGFLVEPRLVVSLDPIIEERFIESITVRATGGAAKAEPAAFCRNESAVLLRLEKPIEGTQPLAFDPKGEGPYLALTYSYDQWGWTAAVQGLSPAAAVTETGRRLLAAPPASVILTETGAPVGMTISGELAADGSWKGSPSRWPALDAADLAKFRDRTSAAADRAILRVQLGFRSPKKGDGADAFPSSEDDGQSVTERNVAGLLIGPKRVLVLDNLAPKMTARLERILVHRPQAAGADPADGGPLAATFECTLADYGGFVAALENPLDGVAVLADGDLRNLDRTLLMGADVRIRGEDRVVYLCRRRIARIERGWKQNLYPLVPGPDESLFLFDEQGRLEALPIARRLKAGRESRWQSRQVQLTAAAQVAPVLADLAKQSDPDNVPLAEQQEDRVAWMGVILQALNRDLARANGISQLTRDGQTGAIVSYVYPGSPADQAGVRPGWIILRLHVEGTAKPLEVNVSYDRYADWEFPWDRLDEVPDQVLERVPAPWPAVQDNFTRMITGIGFGKTYRAELVVDGKVVFKDFTVVESPPHYRTAPKFKSDALGVTVRDMTYEVRRYLQKTAEDPGVVVARVEPGSKIAVAGVKPFEVITHVNDKPVRTVEEFQKAIGGQKVLRLSVNRRLTGRVVKVETSGGGDAAPAPASPPSSPEEVPSGESRSK